MLTAHSTSGVSFGHSVGRLAVGLAVFPFFAACADHATAPSPPPSGARTVTMTDLGNQWTAAAIGPDGRIVGYGKSGTGFGRAVVWDRGVLTYLGTVVGSDGSSATGINATGQIIGWASTGQGRRAAVVWESASGPPSVLEAGTGRFDEAYAINSVGDIVGVTDAGGGAPGADLRGALWRRGQRIQLGTLGGPWSYAYGINASGQVVGSSSTRDAFIHAFLWKDGVMTDLGTLRGGHSSAAGINARGQVVGSSKSGEGDEHAFLWEGGLMTDLGTLGGPDSEARGINALGQVVGWSETSAGEAHAFFWEHGVMTDLGTLGGTESAAFGISESGQIVGVATTREGDETERYHVVVWTVK